MNRLIFKNATIVTGERSAKGALSVYGDKIDEVFWNEAEADSFILANPGIEVVDLGGKLLMAGCIDTHVHFREPGMESKATIGSESKAALTGGVTSFVDMPNTNPPTVNLQRLSDKLKIAETTSYSNYGFHIGATDGNFEEIQDIVDSGKGSLFGGIKVFMGSSTGNMLVDKAETLKRLFQYREKEILIHSESENVIRTNLEIARKHFGDEIPFSEHEFIRSIAACVQSTERALDMALKYGTRLHILHVSTAEEVYMIEKAKRSNPAITAETSPNYLWFCDEAYFKMKGLVKCNPSIKTVQARTEIRHALKERIIDTVGSDHAPHLLSEKTGHSYIETPSGIPSIQQEVSVALSVAAEEGIPLTTMASALSEKVARMFGIEKRGILQKGNYADLMVINPEEEFIVGKDRDISGTAGIDYKCGWSPYEGTKLKYAVKAVYLNGKRVADCGRLLIDEPEGQALKFDN